MSYAKCKGCGIPIVWNNQKHSFRLLKKKGYSDDMIKAALPRCIGCVKTWMTKFQVGSSIEVENTQASNPSNL